MAEKNKTQSQSQASKTSSSSHILADAGSSSSQSSQNQAKDNSLPQVDPLKTINYREDGADNRRSQEIFKSLSK